jgi:hypothetical protein
MAALTFNSSRITMVYGGKLITGWADGDFVKVTFNSDAVTLTMGTDGLGTRSFSRDFSGTVEITLLASSPSNDYLSSVFVADQQTSSGTLPFILREQGGATLVTAETMWVKKQVDVAYSRQVSARVWTLETDNMTVVAAGTTSAVAI